jgi:xanthine dehydrogenase accessory factor
MTTAGTHERLASVARSMLATGPEPAVAARVVDIQGFSTWPGDELVVVDGSGVRFGQVLGPSGAASVVDAAGPLLQAGSGGLATAVVEIHGDAVVEAGLSCGGRAELLLQPTSTIPGAFWELLAARAAVALLTRLDGPGSRGGSLVVAAGGRTWGSLDPPGEDAVAVAEQLVAGGHSATRRTEDSHGTVLVEAWVPDPRLVVIGAGDLVGALAAQAGLLGWEQTAVDDRPAAGGAWPAMDDALAWAGASAALVVLSHDPHVDVPALGAALDAGVAYIGAMGSRQTQSRRLDRLAASGRGPADLDRIHRPIGLDLGGRSAAEVALAICAEVLACHCGRDGRPLKDRDGPIHDRPAAPGRS